jgi:hypothetical protein
MTNYNTTCFCSQATAIFQAKQKLDSVNQASSKRISSEELIKYAHKISASNAVAAPPTWQLGKAVNSVLLITLMSWYFTFTNFNFVSESFHVVFVLAISWSLNFTVIIGRFCKVVYPSFFLSAHVFACLKKHSLLQERDQI